MRSEKDGIGLLAKLELIMGDEDKVFFVDIVVRGILLEQYGRAS